MVEQLDCNLLFTGSHLSDKVGTGDPQGNGIEGVPGFAEREMNSPDVWRNGVPLRRGPAQEAGIARKCEVYRCFKSRLLKSLPCFQ